MPVVTGASKSLPALDSSICEQPWLCSRLATSVLVITIVLTVLLLSRRFIRQRLPKQLVRVSGAGQDIAWASGTTFSSIIVNLPAVLGYWVRLKQGQGQGHFEKRANRAVSRGGASGTALAGLGGSREGGGMEEEVRISAGSRSRGVSRSWTDEARRSDGLLSYDQLLVTAEKSDDVGPSPEGSPAGFHEGQDKMEDARYGGLVGIGAGSDVGAVQESRGRNSTSFFGDYMADDEHILYGASELSHTGSAIGHWSSSHQNFSLDFSRAPPPRPFTPPASVMEISSGLTAHRDHLKSVKIPSRVATSSRSIWGNDGEVLGGRDSAVSRLEDGACSSSYPPTSPLLPPPPPTTSHEAFDPAVVMFPGPARDGGVRMVSAHGHGEAGSGGTHGGAASDSDTPRASWTRHTRVFGGGVCLACAAAAGDGGFYGDSVRPEDKR